MSSADGTTALVTGATGFVGRPVCETLQRAGYSVRRLLRSGPRSPAGGDVVAGDIASYTGWCEAVRGVDVVVHLAAMVHDLGTRGAAGSEELYRSVNLRPTRALAEAAAAEGVSQFVFMSTIKVLGESTPAGQPFSESDPAAPADPYALSKWEAEEELRQLDGFHATTILRPPLVYGPGVGANFLRLLDAVRRGVPLPFGAIHNRRSLVYVHNLADLVAHTVRHRHGGTWVVADGPPCSTPELVDKLARGLGRPSRLLPVPVWIVRSAGALAGRAAEVDRLVSSLEVDAAGLERDLGWTPPVGRAEAIGETCGWYLDSHKP